MINISCSFSNDLIKWQDDVIKIIKSNLLRVYMSVSTQVPLYKLSIFLKEITDGARKIYLIENEISYYRELESVYIHSCGIF